MTRSILCALFAGLILWPSCRGGSAATILPPPESEDRPAGSPPELPRVTVEIPPEPAGVTRVLYDGDDLQNALDEARPGDVLVLEAGAVFKGPVTLPKKPGNEWITIRTSTTATAFPQRGMRVDPSHAPLMPVIEADGGWAVAADPGAHHYRFVGVLFRPAAGTFVMNLIQLGADERRLEDVPHHLIFERCYIHGDPRRGGRRGIALNSSHTAVVDSYIADFKEEGADSQALAGWNGPGPFSIINNYLEGAGENLIFGGADPDITNLVPSDIVVRGNHFSKSLRWKEGEPGYDGAGWAIKNLFELKNARRVLVEDNVFEHNWEHAQSGFAILFTPRNQDGASPWSMVRDVTFVRNVVRQVAAAVNIMGVDDIHPSEQTKRIVIRDNFFEQIGGDKWGGSGRLFQILGGTADIVIEHNTAFHTGDIISADGEPNSGFVYRSNITPHNEYGVGGTNTYGDPLRTLATYFPGAVFVDNVLIGGEAAYYPPQNYFPATALDVGFVDLTRGDYRLAPGSPYKAAGTDGKDIGAGIEGPEAGRRRVRIVRGR